MEKGLSHNELMSMFLFYFIYSFLSTKNVLGSCSLLLSHVFLISERLDKIVPQTLRDVQSVISHNEQLNLFGIYEGIHTCLYHFNLYSKGVSFNTTDVD